MVMISVGNSWKYTFQPCKFQNFLGGHASNPSADRKVRGFAANTAPNGKIAARSLKPRTNIK